MSKHITYTLSVTVEQRLSADPDDPDYPTMEGATSGEWRRRLERDVTDRLNSLKGYGQRVTNVDLVNFTVEEGQ